MLREISFIYQPSRATNGTTSFERLNEIFRISLIKTISNEFIMRIPPPPPSASANY